MLDSPKGVAPVWGGDYGQTMIPGMWPLCIDCWRSWCMRVHGRYLEPIRESERRREICDECARITREGIYVGYRKERPGEDLAS